MTDELKQKIFQWLIPVLAGVLGGSSIIMTNPMGWDHREHPYTSIMAERDQQIMRNWVAEYVETHVPSPEVSIKLDILTQQVAILSGKIDALQEKVK